MTYTASKKSIICLSHLGWDRLLFQRPHQIMQRLALRGHKVHYVGCVGWKRFRECRSSDAANSSEMLKVTHVPYAATPQSAEAVRRFAVSTWLRSTSRGNNRYTSDPGNLPVGFIYHPGLLPLAKQLPLGPIVYDVMDRFAAFHAAGSTTVDLEQELLAQSSLTITGGRSLHRAVTQQLLQSASVIPRSEPVCIPSGVDLNHFARAMNPETIVPPELAQLSRPVFGYYGAVDERLDFDLLRSLARVYPGGTVVLIGPVIAQLPVALPPNLRFLGARDYQQLPGCLKAFDVCLLPFRQSELVAHVSPTKTPEYLAGGKPVVATAIPDVEADYADSVAVCHTSESFLSACAAALLSPSTAQELARAARRSAKTWDEIADQVSQLIEGLPG